MKEERLICPTTPKLSTVTERCLKPKLRITTTPRNGHIHFVMHMCRNCPALSSTDAKALDVGRSRVALVLVLRFEA